MKSVALKLISLGVRPPDALVDRFMELSRLKQLLQILKVDCVLDVGANLGQFAHELRAIGYSGQMVSFEPLKREFDALSASFAHDPRWSGHRVALGNANMTTEINVPELTVMSSLLEFAAENSSTRKERIHLARLDDLFPSIAAEMDQPRVFLKMDTQGYDLEVFKGARQTLQYIVGLQSELSIHPSYKNMPHYNEALSAYESAGFELVNLSVVTRVENGSPRELNASMRRPDGWPGSAAAVVSGGGFVASHADPILSRGRRWCSRLEPPAD